MEYLENYFKFKFRSKGFWFLLFLLFLQQQSTNASSANKTFSLTEGPITHSGQLKRANGGVRNRNGVADVIKSKVKKSHLHRVTPQNLYPPEDITSPNEDYFASYDSDYSMQQQVKSNFSSLIYDNEPENAAIFPNPEMMVFESDKNDEQTQSSEPDILPEVDLPGNWLSDSDLRERDRIDSVEYVYYGASRGTGGSGAGRWNTPVVSGAGVSALILLAAGWTLLKRKGFRSSKMFPVEMNMICCLLVTNVMLLVGVQDTAVQTRCEVIALLLHYMHLVCASWITVYCYVISDNVTKGCVPNLRYNYLFAYGVPAVLVLFFYAISIESYETKEYCWMSLEKGMLLGLMVPGTILILSNTLIAMVGLKAVSKKRQEGMASTIQARIAGVNKCGQVQAAKYTSTNSLASVDSRRAEPTTVETKSRTFEDQGTVEGTSWMRTCSAGQILETLDHREPSLYRNDSFKIDLSNLSMDNLSWKSAEPEGIGDMRKCLNFALLLQPLFCVFWFMGVVALENANQPLPPFVFAFLWSSMHIFIFFRLTRVLPYIPFEADSAWSGTTDNPSSIADSTQQPSKSTDTIPLLVTKVESPPSISTISH